MTPRTANDSQRVIVVGAGVVGLSIGCFLLLRGEQVTILEKGTLGAGASWGNAGFVTPELMGPLGDPSVFRSVARAFFDADFPVHIPLSASPGLLRFLTGFARNSTRVRWRRGMEVFDHLRAPSIDAYDELLSNGLDAGEISDAEPLIIAFDDRAKRDAYLHLLQHEVPIRASATATALDREETRALEPLLKAEVEGGIALAGQRMVDPPRFLEALHALYARLGGRIQENSTVVSVTDGGHEVEVELATRETLSARHVVLATGAYSTGIARRFGVRTPLYAGRGYSFRVTPPTPVTHPIYMPEQRLACVPVQAGLRVTGVMEFLPPEAPLDPHRLGLVADAASKMLDGVDWSARADEWVGARPTTSDGLPLIGSTRSTRVHMATGHGMWGVVLGPLTGRLIADIITNRPGPSVLRALDPLRGNRPLRPRAATRATGGA